MKTPRPLTDEKELLLRLQQGDHRAFNRLYDAFRDKLFGNLYHMLRDRDTVEELVQDLFMNVWNNREQIDPDRPIKAYLFRIAANLARNAMKRAYHDQRMRSAMVASAGETYTHVEEDLIREENTARLHRLLDQLPPQRRQVYVLCKLDGKTYKEVSAELGISEVTVNDHIKKANAYFRNLHFDPLVLLALGILLL